MASRFKYWAFISYSHQDAVFAERLHQRVEGFRVPRKLRASRERLEIFPARIFPVFIDRAELSAGDGLDQKIRRALEQSRYLIIVCSRASLDSTYVAAEVDYFLELGKAGALLPIITSTEDPDLDPLDLLPAACRGSAGPPLMDGQGLLIADAREGRDGVTRASFKIIAGILSVSVGELAHRYATRRRWNLAGLSLMVLLISVLGWQAFEQEKQKSIAQKRGEALRMAEVANGLIEQGAAAKALIFLLSAFPRELASPDRPVPILTLKSLQRATVYNRQIAAFRYTELEGAGNKSCLRFIDDTHLLAVSMTPSGVWDRRIVDLATGLFRNTDFAILKFTNGLALMADCHWILELGANRLIEAHDLEGPEKVLFPWPSHSAPTVAAASSNRRMLAVGDSSGVIRLWDPETGRSLKDLAGGVGEIQRLRFSDSGSLLASVDQSNAIRILGIEAKSTPVSFSAGEVVTSLAWIDDDSKLMVGTVGGGVSTYDSITGGVLDRFRLPNEAVLSLEPIEGGQTVVATNRGRFFISGAGSAWSNPKSQFGVRRLLPAIAMDEGRTHLASLSKDGIVRIFDVSKKKLQTIEAWELASLAWGPLLSPGRDVYLKSPGEFQVVFALLTEACSAAFGPTPHSDAWTSQDLNEYPFGDEHLDPAFEVCQQVWIADRTVKPEALPTSAPAPKKARNTVERTKDELSAEGKATGISRKRFAW